MMTEDERFDAAVNALANAFIQKCYGETTAVTLSAVTILLDNIVHQNVNQHARCAIAAVWRAQADLIDPPSNANRTH